MSLDLEIQNESPSSDVPDANDLRRWVAAVLQKQAADITLRIVDKADSEFVNKEFRNKKGPTNVLSFPYQLDEDDQTVHGDILICGPIVHEEAEEIGIPALSHWAHLTVHACYHLLGYDHQTDEESKKMEALEIKTLAALGFDNPYEIIDELYD